MSEETQENPQAVDAAEAQNAETPSLDQAVLLLEEENKKLKDQWIRAVADLDNLRKRADRDISETAKYAASGFAKDLISVAENLQRALDSVPEEGRKEGEPAYTLWHGVEMTLKELLAGFERNGIKRIDPYGEKFDHNFHQAVVQIETPDAQPGTIVQVMQAGYVMHDRLLKPAMVGVAKGGDAKPKVDTAA